MLLSEFFGGLSCVLSILQGGRYALKVVFSAYPPTMYASKRKKTVFCPFLWVFSWKKPPKFIKWGYHVRVYYVFMLFFILLFHKVYFLTCNFFEKKQKNVRSDSFPWNSVQNRSKRQNNRKRVESSKARQGKSVTERERVNTAKSEKMHSVPPLTNKKTHSVPLSVIKNRPFEHGKGGKKKSKTPVARHF